MTAQWIDLSQPLFPGMPGAKPHGEFEHWTDHVATPNPIHIRITHVKMAAHMGTHIDAAAHFMPDGKVIDGYPTSHFVGEGVVLDIQREGVSPIDVDDIKMAGPPIREGDIVLIYTGYASRFGTEDIHSSGHPYITEEAAHWLVAKGVRLFGMDVFTPDLPDGFRPDGFDWPVHQILLGHDTLIIENLGPGLAKVAGHRVEVLAVPIRVHDSDAGPVVPLARVIS
ncbi:MULTISPECIES: cyclase family protein [unclassified Cryobacterium]|uniref:cyclase family protein n=1 Tax=unclassified Cryobacterium TaxID=2649013 RepID=UPI00141B3900|nr:MULTISPECIES: cyclase family protein [unclassified Cryobacterium]